MPPRDPIDAVRTLAEASRAFGPGAAERKLAALADVARADLGDDDVAAVRRTLDFVRAYPDDATVLRRTRDVLAALPPAPPVEHVFSWGTVRRLVRVLPGKVEIAWDRVEDHVPLCGVLELVVAPAETPAVLDPAMTFEDWFARCRPRDCPTDLACLVAMLEASGLPETVQAHLYDGCGLTLRYEGPPSCDVVLPGGRLHPQRRPFERERFPLEPEIRRPLGTVTPGGQEVVDAALQALAARSLEIFALISANPRDVRVVDAGRGLRIGFVGVLPAFREALETHGFFLVTKNGAPLGYGPVGAFLGVCEMGINLFPEFRGAEIRRVWAEVMRALHHLYGVEHFFLTRYGMGERNPEAIESGAFWFYRKLGFVPDNPAVEALARAEEARMAADPSHRSDRAMLRRLSHTEAHFDLSGGRRTAFPFTDVALAVSARGRTQDAAAAEIARVLRLPRGTPGLRLLAPVLAAIPDLARWTPAEKRALARIVRAKGGDHEALAARLFCGHARLEASLRELARPCVRSSFRLQAHGGPGVPTRLTRPGTA